MTTTTTKTTIAAILAVTVLAVFTVPTAFATDYHSGNIWSSSTHSSELHNGKAPLAFNTSELSSNLVLESGTTISLIYSVMENAIDDIDATLAVTYPTTHWFFGSDGHLTKTLVDFNHDDYDWDHNGDDSGTDTIYMYNVALHEFGHTIGLCDTYGGVGIWDDCHGYNTSLSMMYSYTYGVTETITSKDTTEINREY